MSDAAAAEQTSTKRGSKPLFLGLGLAAILGACGFVITYTGLLRGGASGHGETAQTSHLQPTSYVPIEPILISLSHGARPRHLRFRAELEVEPNEQHNVELLMPRVLDVLNSYLRAVDVEDLERQTSLIGLRAQMLRRVRLVVGENRVRDLLVTEFVLN
ncbi:flagellar basal body-associated protein FliL [Tropicimonas sp. IMCC34043]|uniref:flagellar basal body-associated FliL family protein n=1 Tax=Tropicimonas sp. IMCC34043 TaxID=2248760 RepID=UPI000E284B45|nr:flagellar basal body-associated FliL family protein [Tropicimonas sp. IMCC34043]